MPIDLKILSKIRAAQTELCRAQPYRDTGLVPNPAASEAAIVAAEQRLGLKLPVSYREFLRAHDGWPRFYEGATLLGTSQLGKRSYDELLAAVFRASETPVPEIGPPSAESVRPRLIPFAADLQGLTLFAFDTQHGASDGELAVVAWVNELGIRAASFSELLESVLDWVVADLEALQEISDQPVSTRKSA
jgi:hypothetical protein